MTDNGTAQHRKDAPRTVACVHVQDRKANIVVATQSGGGVVLRDARAVELDQLRKTLAGLKPDRVIGIIPSASSICRLVDMPAADSPDREELAAALALVCEAELGDAAPAHRRSAGLLATDASSAAVVQGWAVAPDGDTTGEIAEAVHAWVTEPAALALLTWKTCRRSVGVSFDRPTGSLAAVVAGPTGGMVRVTRLPVDTIGVGGEDGAGGGWAEEIDAAIGETCASVGITDAPVFPVADQHAVRLHPPGAADIGGHPRDISWVSQFGIAFAGAEMALSDDPCVRSLPMLTRDAPAPAAPIAERVLESLSRPGTAAALLLICAAVFLFGPLAAAAARYHFLAGRSGGVDAIAEQLDDAHRGADFNKLLRDERLPMTKLLADLTGAAPVDVRFQVIDVSRDGLSVYATAESTDLVAGFRESLVRTRVFGDIEIPNRSESTAGVEFQLNASITNPLYGPVVIEDFAEQTLAQRMYGGDAKGWDASDASAAPGGQPAARASRRSRRPSRAEDDDTPASPLARRGASRETAASVPEPLTDDQIAQMDRATAMKEWTSRKRAAARADDETVKARLAEESEKCKERMLAAGAGG